MYEIYSVNVEKLKIKLYIKAESFPEAIEKLFKVAKEFIRVEQGDKFSENPFWDSHNPPRPGYYLTHSDSPNVINVYYKNVTEEDGFIWKNYKTDYRKVMVFSFCECSQNNISNVVHNNPLICSNSVYLNKGNIIDNRERALTELKDVLKKRFIE